MKKTSLKIVTAALFAITSQAIAGQANRQLSNLITPTKVNQNLLPNTDNTKNLGSTAKSWKDVYIDGTLYLNGIAMARAQPFASETFFGWEAGNSNIGGNNSAFGYRALWENTTGAYNTALGLEALLSNLSGSANNAVGYAALHANNGNNNNAIGDAALYLNTSGNDNQAIGTQALWLNFSGSNNQAMGSAALDSNSTGNYNQAIGTYALHRNKMGSSNVAIGNVALLNNISGSYNTAIGTNSLLSNEKGLYNTVLGAYADVNTTNLINATAIGYKAIVNASNKVVIGNTAVEVIGGYAPGGWSILSDGRFKKDIKGDVPGLEFINKLKPVTYHLEARKFEKFLGKSDSVLNQTKTAYDKAESRLRTGFVAQDVEKAAKELEYDFDGIHHPENDKDNYSLSYDVFVVPLVKAMQELSKQNDELKKQNELQQKEINELKAMMISLNQSNTSSTTSDKLPTGNPKSASLEQNTPNPFNRSTVIRYSVPSTAAFAKIIITDNAGKVVRQINVSAVSKGMINIEGGSLSSGTYNYSLIADGMLIDTKKMAVAK